MRQLVVFAVLSAASFFHFTLAADVAQTAPPVLPKFDSEQVKSLGGNENGMRSYVLVLLRNGPNKMPEGAARAAMFKGHFANIERLAAERKLALAGPLDDVDGLRGLFVFAVTDINEAKA